MGRKSWTRDRIRRTLKGGRKPRQLLLMGVEKVGKTALIKRFMDDSYTTDYKPTVEDHYNLDYKMPSCSLNLEILDMSGCYQFPAMRDLNIRNTDMVMLVYEVNNVKSFEEVKNLNGIVKVARSDTIPTIVVCAKSDQGTNDEQMQKVVNDFLEAYPECTHIEVSSKENNNVKEAFELLLMALVEKLDPKSLTLRSVKGKRQSSGCGCVLL